MSLLRFTLMSALLCLAGVLALAAPTALILIPTADILPVGEYAGSVDVLASSEDTDVTLSNEIGLFPHIEAGFDYSFSESKGTVNMKLGIPALDGNLAVGVWGLGEIRQWYAVFSTDYEKTPVRLHFGAFTPADSLSPFLGVEIPCHNAVIMLEGVGGTELTGSAGVCFPVSKDLEAAVAGIVEEGGETEFYFSLGTGIDLGRCRGLK